jgi:Protein of unknown function (DUF3631)
MSAMTPLERDFADACMKVTGHEPKRIGKELETLCPSHADKTPSLDFHEEGGKLLVKCRSGCETADVLVAAGLDEKALFPEREKRRPVKKAAAPIVYVYHAADGSPLFSKTRTSTATGKTFVWRGRNGDGWKVGLAGQKPPLYRLPEILATVKAGDTVHVAEGEKCADALAAAGLVSTTAAGGAADSLDAPGLLDPLRGADLILWPDADEPGRQYVERFARKLAGLAQCVRVVSWPDGRPKGFDVADYIGAGAKREDLEALVTAATEYKATASENGAALLRDVRAFIRRYVVLAPEQEVTITLWTLHTWAIVVADMSPYLSVSSAVMRTGKTRLLETVELLVRNPWSVVQPSEAVLFRKLGQGDLTLLFDEVDAVFGKNVSDAQEGIRAVLNCGFKRGATIPRCIDRGQKIEEFAVFGPKLLAGIGLPPPTVRDRSFVIEMKRKKRTESVSRFRRRDAEALAAPLRERLEQWAESAVDGLREARPDLPEKLNDRARDVGEPLLAIADAAGDVWPDLARKALVSLAGEDEGDDDELGVRLLGDVRTVFELLHLTDGEITTAALLSELHAREEAPWKKLHKGEPLDPRELARLLRPFGVRPRTVRQGKETPRGYLVSAFFDPFERYLPPDTLSETSATVQQSNVGAVESVSDDPKHDPKHGAADLPLFGAHGSVSDGVSHGVQQVSANKDGACVTVADVSDRVTEAKPETVPGASPDCWRCQELDRNRLAGARSSAPCDVCGADRPVLRRSVAL